MRRANDPGKVKAGEPVEVVGTSVDGVLAACTPGAVLYRCIVKGKKVKRVQWLPVDNYEIVKLKGGEGFTTFLSKNAEGFWSLTEARSGCNFAGLCTSKAEALKRARYCIKNLTTTKSLAQRVEENVKRFGLSPAFMLSTPIDATCEEVSDV